MGQVVGTGNGLNGDRVLASEAVSAGVPMAARSTRSRSAGSPKDSLTEQDVLAIGENWLAMVKTYWQTPNIVTPENASTPAIIVLPEGIHFCPNCQHLRVLAEMDGFICQHCASTGKSAGKEEE
jgi:hypothetical protein